MHEQSEYRPFKGAPRALDGWISGISGKLYEIVCSGRLVTQADVRPLNEMALVDRGMPSGASLSDKSVQCEMQTPAGRNRSWGGMFARGTRA